MSMEIEVRDVVEEYNRYKVVCKVNILGTVVDVEVPISKSFMHNASDDAIERIIKLHVCNHIQSIYSLETLEQNVPNKCSKLVGKRIVLSKSIPSGSGHKGFVVKRNE